MVDSHVSEIMADLQPEKDDGSLDSQIRKLAAQFVQVADGKDATMVAQALDLDRLAAELAGMGVTVPIER